MTKTDYENIQRMIDECLEAFATKEYVDNGLDDVELDLRNEIPDDNAATISGLEADISTLEDRVSDLEEGENE